MPTLKAGDPCPKIKLLNQDEEWIDIFELSMLKTVVLFFYPKDFTPGCTKEACSFRDYNEQFSIYNATVLGVSMDDVNSHIRFSKTHQLNFPLLSDSDKKARKAFGVPSKLFGLIPGRVTYIIKEGVIKEVIDSLTDPSLHVRKSLELVKIV